MMQTFQKFTPQLGFTHYNTTYAKWTSEKVGFEFEILNKGFDDFPGNRVPLKFTFTLSCDYQIAEVNGADHMKLIDAKTWEITYES